MVPQWRFQIYNLKLRGVINSGKLFIKGISFEILSKESLIGNPEDNLTPNNIETPGYPQYHVWIVIEQNRESI